MLHPPNDAYDASWAGDGRRTAGKRLRAIMNLISLAKHSMLVATVRGVRSAAVISFGEAKGVHGGGAPPQR